MTKDTIKETLLAIIDNTTSAGTAQSLTETELDEITDAVAGGLNTVNPTKEYPPVKL